METFKVTCPACDHAEVTAEAVDLADVGLFMCNACNARVVHGTIVLRVVVEPMIDAKGFMWVRKRYQDPGTRKDVYVVDLDPIMAAGEARAVLSLVKK